MDKWARKSMIMVSIMIGMLVSGFSYQVQAAQGNVVLEKEMKFPVTTGLPLKDVVVATKLGLLNRHWEFRSIDDHTIDAKFEKKNVLVSIRLVVSESQVNMRYVDSKGMSYGTDSGNYGESFDNHPEGTLFIHKAYDKWLRGLFSDIDVEMKRLMVMKGLL